MAFHQSRYAAFKFEKHCCLTKIEYSLTQSKMLLMARCTPNLYECVLSISNADFRLYEFLKNSRPDALGSLDQAQQNQSTYTQCFDFVPDIKKRWWRMTGSNRRPPACKAGALPAELIPRELGCDGLAEWWVWLVSNQRPPPYQDGALTN